MLPAKQVQTHSQSKVISGASHGVKVICSEQAQHKYTQLQTLAQEGNYWAWKVVAGITGLSSGRMHMDNIFVQRNQGYPSNLFYVILPGTLAVFENTFQGSFRLLDLQMDTGYMEMQRKMQRPGLWRVGANLGERPKFVESGTILNKEYRPVVISGQAKAEVRGVVQAVESEIKRVNSTISSMVDQSGFDLHYTPLKVDHLGLIQEKKALLGSVDLDKDLLESAYQLADTMYQARGIPGVLWFGHWDGSVVLSRALEMLKHQKVDLSKHSIFLHRPQEERTKIFSLAKDLGIKQEHLGHKSGLRPKEIWNNHLGSDISAKGTDAGVAFTLSSASAATAVFATTVPAATAAYVGWAGALYFVSKTLLGLKGTISGRGHK